MVSGEFRIYHIFDFVVLVFVVNYFWWRALVVGAMFLCFFIRGKERVMEHQVYVPGWGKLQVGVCGGSREDFKRTVASGG